MLLSLIRMIQAFRDRQRNIAELSQLSDRELADMGIHRSDIPRVAAGNYNGRSTVPHLALGQHTDGKIVANDAEWYTVPAIRCCRPPVAATVHRPASANFIGAI